MWTKEDDKPVIQHLFQWMLARTMGCHFAQYFASKQDLMIGLCVRNALHSKEAATLIDLGLQDAHTQRKPFLMAFPDIDSESAVCALITLLSQGEDWTCKEISIPIAGTTGVGLYWRTPSGKKSRVLGLGPLYTMPPVRRAPYTALALWPGDKENTHQQSPGDWVSFIDTKLPELYEDETKYDKTYKDSEDQTRSLMTGPFRNLKAKDLVKVTFLLSQETEKTLSFEN